MKASLRPYPAPNRKTIRLNSGLCPVRGRAWPAVRTILHALRRFRSREWPAGSSGRPPIAPPSVAAAARVSRYPHADQYVHGGARRPPPGSADERHALNRLRLPPSPA